MKIDERVAKINALMKEQGAKTFSGEVPDMAELEGEINEFIQMLGKLAPNQVRDYANLVNIWAIEIKKMSEKLTQTKSELHAEIKMADVQGKANKAYLASNKPSGT